MLPCDGKVRLEAEGHVYHMLEGDGTWSSAGVLGATTWIKRHTGEDERKFFFMARAQAEAINRRFLAGEPYLPEYYDRFPRRDWDAMRACLERRATVPQAFGDRLRELVRPAGDPRLRQWAACADKSPADFERVFGAHETRVLALPPHLTAEDVRAMWPRFGTRLHKDIELALLGMTPTQGTTLTREWTQVRRFLDHHLRPKLRVLRTELALCVPELRLCGQLDCLARRRDGGLVVLDWKRTARLAKKQRGAPMPAPWAHRAQTPLDAYTLQLNVYAFMLGRLGVQVAELGLVCFHREMRGFQYVPVPLFAPGSEDARALEWMVQEREREVREAPPPLRLVPKRQRLAAEPTPAD